MKTLQYAFILFCITPFAMLLPFSFYLVCLMLGIVLLLIISTPEITNKEKQRISALIIGIALSIVAFYWLFAKAVEHAENGTDSLLVSIPTPVLFTPLIVALICYLLAAKTLYRCGSTHSVLQ